MDALAWLQRQTRSKTGLYLFCILCAFPVVAGIFARFTRHGWAFMDADAMFCAARNMAAGGSPYDLHPLCPGMTPAAFVYAPQLAWLLTSVVTEFGALNSRFVFVACLILPATGFLLWFALVRALPGIDVRYRWLAFAALTPMTFCCANIGLVLHAVVLLALLAFPKRSWVFTLAVLACACIKPTFLMYFMLPLFQDRPFTARLSLFILQGVTGMAVVSLVWLTSGMYGLAWRDAVHAVALAREPGLGWLALTSWLGVEAGSSLNVLLALGFMTVMGLSGLAIAHWGKLSEQERLLLGLGLVPLMTPRLMDYDMILIVPYAALMVSLASRIGSPRFGRVASWVFFGVLALGILTNILHFKPYHRTHIAMFLFANLSVAVAVRLLQVHGAEAAARLWPAPIRRTGSRSEIRRRRSSGRGSVRPAGSTKNRW